MSWGLELATISHSILGKAKTSYFFQPRLLTPLKAIPPGAAAWETEKDNKSLTPALGNCGSHTLALRAPRTTKATFTPESRQGKHPLLARSPTALYLPALRTVSCVHQQVSLAHLWEIITSPVLFSGDTLHIQRWSPHAGASTGAALSCQTSLHETEWGQLKFGVWTMGIVKGSEKWATTGPPPSCVQGYHLLRYFCFSNKDAFAFEAHI